MRLAQLPNQMKTLSEISRIVLSLPEIVDGFLQHTEALDHQGVVKVVGGSGEWIKGDKFRSEYRCFLRTDKKHAERIADNPARAALEVLEELGVECSTALV